MLNDSLKASIFLKAISDETRLKILLILLKDEQNVTGLVQLIGKAQPTISLDLKVLENAGIIRKRVQGKRRFYSIKPEKLAAVRFILEEVGKLEA